MAFIRTPTIQFPLLRTATPNAVTSTSPTGAGITAPVFEIKKSGTVTDVILLTSTGGISGSPTVGVRLETVGTDGYPTGTLYHANGTGTSGTITTNNAHTVTLAGGVPVTQGDVISVPLRVASGTSFGILTMNASPFNIATDYGGYKPAATWSKVSQPYGVFLKYSDGTFEGHDAAPIYYSISNTSFSNAENIEHGNKYVFPFDVQIGGAWMHWQNVGSGSFTVYVYEGTTLIHSESFVYEQNANIAVVPRYCRFNQHITFNKDTDYRVMFRPNASSSMARRQQNFVPGVGFEYNEFRGIITPMEKATNTGVWTDTTAAGRYQACGVLITGVQDTSGGGGATGRYKAKVSGSFVDIQ